MSFVTGALTLLAAIILAVILVRPKTGVLLLLIFYPLHELVYRPPVALVNSQTILVAAALIAALIYRRAERPSVRYVAPFVGFVSVMLLAWTISWASYPDGVPGLTSWDNFKRVKLILFSSILFFAVYPLYSTPTDRLRALEACSFAVGLVSVSGIVDWVFSISSDAALGRATGFAGNPIELGAYASAFCLISGHLLRRADLPTTRRVAHGAFYVLALVCVVLTLTRTAWVAVVVGHVVWLALTGRRILVLSAAAVLMIAPLSYPLLPDFIRRRIEVTFRPGTLVFQGAAAGQYGSSTSERIVYYQIGWSMLRDSPLWGHGLHSFYILSNRYGARYGLLTRKDPHSLPLKVASENGLIGLVCLGWMTIVALTAGLTLWRSSSKERGLGGAFVAVLSTLFVLNLGATVMNSPLVGSLFWSIFALTARGAEELRIARFRVSPAHDTGSKEAHAGS